MNELIFFFFFFFHLRLAPKDAYSPPSEAMVPLELSVSWGGTKTYDVDIEVESADDSC